MGKVSLLRNRKRTKPLISHDEPFKYVIRCTAACIESRPEIVD